MKLFIGILIALMASLIVFNCDAPENCGNGDPAPNYKLTSLNMADSCQAFEQQVKANVIKEMARRVDENLEIALDRYRNGCHSDSSSSGSGCDGGYAPSGSTSSSTSSTSSSSSSSSGGYDTNGGSADSYSETNTQVPGVDEADFVKNDGANIYILTGDQFEIIDAWPPASAAVLSATPIAGTPKKLFVYNNKALIYSSIDDAMSGRYPRGECTYGYDCDFTGDGLMLKITLFDIADKTAPKLEREILFDGAYLNSRRIGSIVYTAVVFPEFTLQGLVYWPAGVPDCPYSETTKLSEAEITAAFTKLKADNVQRINAVEGSNLLPAIKDTRYVNGCPVVTDNVLDGCSGFYLSQSPEGRSLLSLVSLAIDGLEPLSATTIVGKPGAIYASKDSLYMASRQYRGYFSDWYFEDSQDIAEATTIHKFKLSTGVPHTEYTGSGVVKGRVLNQFSMDESDGYLRMATTTGHVAVGGSDVHSTLLTLKEDAARLVVAGTVDHIAPSEDIRSVRFDGDKAFVVTFKKTDPLFAFDLSDPEKPVLAGELEIPGFSTYIHLMDETHLLTIGYDAQDNDVNAYFQGIMLQIFDVSDMSAPVLAHKAVIGTRGTNSDAATNHLAFNYFAPKNLLALPMVICEESTGMSDYGDFMTFSGLMVYRVTTDEGFSYLGGISHQAPETQETYGGYCYNWWTESNSIVKRSIIMEDYVYSIALDAIRVAHVDSLNTTVAAIELVQ